MARNNKNGLLALLGIGAGAWAFWKYKTMSPQEKDQLKTKINDAGEKLKKTVNDLEARVGNEYDRIKNSAKHKADEIIDK